ncbi:MAG: ACT domain-containing protein, partial [Monoglobaceae bacterium]
DITAAVSEFKIGIVSVNARTGKNNIAIIDLTMEVSNTEQLDKVIKKIQAVDGVISIARKRQ